MHNDNDKLNLDSLWCVYVPSVSGTNDQIASIARGTSVGSIGSRALGSVDIHLIHSIADTRSMNAI